MNELKTAEQVARILQCSVKTVHRYSSDTGRRHLPCLRHGRRKRFRGADVESWIRRNTR